MLNFIYVCVAVVILSFVAVPVVNGVSKEYRQLDQNEQIADLGAQEYEALSFEEIYAVVDAEKQQQASQPKFLNDIMPAAGEDPVIEMPDEFSSSFTPNQHPAF